MSHLFFLRKLLMGDKMIKKIIENGQFIDFVDLFADQIYFDLDNVILIFQQEGKKGLCLCPFRDCLKAGIDCEACKPFVVYQYFIEDEEVKRKKAVLLDIGKIGYDKNERFHCFLKMPNLRKYLIDLCKEKINYSVIVDDIEGSFQIDIDNKIITVKNGLNDPLFVLSVLQAYSEILFIGVCDKKEYLELVDRMIVLSITDEFAVKSVPVTNFQDINNDDLIKLLNDIRSVVLRTRWDLYEKKFDWKEIMFLLDSNGTKEEVVDYFANFDVDLANKINELNTVQVYKLQKYLEKGLTVYPVCLM